MGNIDFKVSTYIKAPRYIVREEIEELEEYINYKHYKQEPYSDEIDWELSILEDIYNNTPNYIWVVNYIRYIPRLIKHTITNISWDKKENNKDVKTNDTDLPF